MRLTGILASKEIVRRDKGNRANLVFELDKGELNLYDLCFDEANMFEVGKYYSIEIKGD